MRTSLYPRATFSRRHMAVSSFQMWVPRGSQNGDPGDSSDSM